MCQLAVLGYVFPEFIRFPGEIAPGLPFASIPNGLAAVEAIPALGWFQIIFLVGFVDYRLTTFGEAVPFTNPKVKNKNNRPQRVLLGGPFFLTV